MEYEATVIEKLANWVDTRVIAEAIVSHLVECGEEVTFEKGKGVWLRQLETILH